MRRLRLSLIVVAILLIAAVAAIPVIYNRNGFSGEQIKSSDLYSLDIQYMNGADCHTLNLTDGDVLQVEFETEKGSLNMEITAPSGKIIYDGNGKNVKLFEINIPETGAYTVTVNARHAKGKINIKLKGIVKAN